MARTSSITVQSKGEVISAPQSKKIVRQIKKDEEIQLQPEAIAIEEEFNNTYDFSQRLAIFQALIDQEQAIKAFANKEEQIAEALEYARLSQGEQAKTRGRQKARDKFNNEKLQEFRKAKQEFLDTQLDQLIDRCSHLGFERMQMLVNQAAAMVGVKLQWKQLENGTFECATIENE